MQLLAYAYILSVMSLVLEVMQLFYLPPCVTCDKVCTYLYHCITALVYADLVFTIRECCIVIHSVMFVSMCVCLSVCVSFCWALSVQSLNLQTSFWYVGTSLEYLGHFFVQRSSDLKLT